MNEVILKGENLTFYNTVS